MRELRYVIKTVLIFVLILITSRCSPQMLATDYPFYVIYYEYDNLKPAVYPEEIERLQGIIQTSRETSALAKAHLRLAFLYSDYRNPANDYENALKELEAFMSLDSTGGRQIHFQTWLKILRELAKTERENRELKEKIEQLNREMATLEKGNTETLEQQKKEMARLEKENSEIKEKLEQLKHLDIEMEEKRKLVK